MKTYITKAKEVKAILFNRENIEEVLEFIIEYPEISIGATTCTSKLILIDGNKTVCNEGQWIIIPNNSWIQYLSQEEFEKLYEPKKKKEKVKKLIKKGCFGNPEYYDDKDEFCYEHCEYFKDCGQEIKENKNKFWCFGKYPKIVRSINYCGVCTFAKECKDSTTTK